MQEFELLEVSQFFSLLFVAKWESPIFLLLTDDRQRIFLSTGFWCGFHLPCSIAAPGSPHITLLVPRVFLLNCSFLKTLAHRVMDIQLQVSVNRKYFIF